LKQTGKQAHHAIMHLLCVNVLAASDPVGWWTSGCRRVP